MAFRPGLTGMWQVSGRSNITDFEEVVKLDTEYINEWSLRLDLKILVDPDDNIGPHFVESFMREMTEQYDFIAMGFFQNDNGIYKACPLAVGVNCSVSY